MPHCQEPQSSVALPTLFSEEIQNVTSQYLKPIKQNNHIIHKTHPTFHILLLGLNSKKKKIEKLNHQKQKSKMAHTSD